VGKAHVKSVLQGKVVLLYSCSALEGHVVGGLDASALVPPSCPMECAVGGAMHASLRACLTWPSSSVCWKRGGGGDTSHDLCLSCPGVCHGCPMGVPCSEVPGTCLTWHTPSACWRGRAGCGHGAAPALPRTFPEECMPPPLSIPRWLTTHLRQAREAPPHWLITLLHCQGPPTCSPLTSASP